MKATYILIAFCLIGAAFATTAEEVEVYDTLNKVNFSFNIFILKIIISFFSHLSSPSPSEFLHFTPPSPLPPSNLTKKTKN
jgi:hypothetical protein